MDREVLNELVRGILETLGATVECIILYGSMVRGTNTADSDVDIAVLLNGQMDSTLEDRLSDFIVDMNLKHDMVFSVIDIELQSFIQWGSVLPFYQNVEKEGIVLWKAA